MNTFYHGDCLFVMNRDIPAEYVDLIYLDPPFFTGKVQKGKWKGKWHPEAMEISFEDSKSYWARHLDTMRQKAPIWLNDIGGKHPEFGAYLYYMMERLQACKRVLKQTGSIYLHCDWRASHYLKVVMDDIFGAENFRDNIVWCYKTREFAKKYWNRKHDDILFYTKSGSYTFKWDVDGVIEHHSPVTIKKYRYKDEKGYYRLCGRGITGSPIRSAKDVDPMWEKTNPELVVRNYLTRGYAPSDYWNIRIINQMAKERVGDPTQKANKPSPDRGVDGITITDGIPIQTKTFRIGYEVIDKLISSSKYHPLVPKPIKKVIVVSQIGFDDSARQRKFEIKNTEGKEVILTTPEEMLALDYI